MRTWQDDGMHSVCFAIMYSNKKTLPRLPFNCAKHPVSSTPQACMVFTMIVLCFVNLHHDWLIVFIQTSDLTILLPLNPCFTCFLTEVAPVPTVNSFVSVSWTIMF